MEARFHAVMDKHYGECQFKKYVYSERHITINLPQNTWPSFELTPSFFVFSEAVLEVLFCVFSGTVLASISWIDSKPLPFSYCGFGKELEVTQYQIWWIRWMRLYNNVFTSLTYCWLAPGSSLNCVYHKINRRTSGTAPESGRNENMCIKS